MPRPGFQLLVGTNERGPDPPPELSAGSITGVARADFHRPDRFELVTRIG